MSDAGGAIHLFSNGSEFEFWEARNCSRCVKEPSCDLLRALFTDGLEPGLYQGQVLPETARRLGYSQDAHGGTAGWICKERRTPDADPRAPLNVEDEQRLAERPAAEHVRASGAPELPGFGEVEAAEPTRRPPWSA